MIDVLRAENQLENVNVVDINENIVDFGDLQGVPAFVSKLFGTGTVGYKSSVAHVIRDLRPTERLVRSNAVNPLIISSSIPSVVFIDATCSVCYDEITKAVIRPCLHAFCVKCSEKLVKCPKCNAN